MMGLFGANTFPTAPYSGRPLSAADIDAVGGDPVARAAIAALIANGGSAGSVSFASITGKPTTLAGYGITDAVVNFAQLGGKPTTLAGYGITDGIPSFAQITGKPTTIAGYGITDAVVNFSQLGGKPTTLAGYGITDALSSTGTAAAATKLANARTINGQSFDGTANITINAVDSTARLAITSYVKDVNFSAAGTAIIRAEVAMTLALAAAAVGAGALSYEKSTNNGGAFASTTLPVALNAGDLVRITATGAVFAQLARTA